MPLLTDLTSYLDQYLHIQSITDYPNAFNGLQFENNGKVTCIGAAVDGSAKTVALAAELKVDFLLVHHGLFWEGLLPVVGARYKLYRCALENNIAVYGAHLPLDADPTLGNNVGLVKALGFAESKPDFEYKGTLIGQRVRIPSGISRAELIARLESAVQGPVRVCPGGPDLVKDIAIITGGAGNEARSLASTGVDTFITGEGAHWTYALAEDLGMNILYGGHYATETFGVKSLAAHLSEKFGVPWKFIDHPTHL